MFFPHTFSPSVHPLSLILSHIDVWFQSAIFLLSTPSVNYVFSPFAASPRMHSAAVLFPFRHMSEGQIYVQGHTGGCIFQRWTACCDLLTANTEVAICFTSQKLCVCVCSWVTGVLWFSGIRRKQSDVLSAGICIVSFHLVILCGHVCYYLQWPISHIRTTQCGKSFKSGLVFRFKKIF